MVRNNNNNNNNNNNVVVPSELITEILSRLPVKSLLRFKCVSKYFNSTINGRDFIKYHIAQSLSNDTNRSLLIIERESPHYHGSGSIICFDYDSLKNHGIFYDPLNDCCDNLFLEGICHGILCLRWYEQDSDPTNVLTLVNLATRKYRVLPHLKLEDFEDHGDGLCQCECGCVNVIDDDEQDMEDEDNKAEEHSNEDGEMQSLPLEETEQQDGALQPVPMEDKEEQEQDEEDMQHLPLEEEDDEDEDEVMQEEEEEDDEEYDEAPSVVSTFLAFGYDASNDDYKVVKVINYDDGDTHLFVYSLKENAWRKVKNSCSPYSLRDVIGACPFLSGKIHYMVAKKDVTKKETFMIVTFDLATEEFNEVPLPDCFLSYDNIIDPYLIVLEGCLCVVLFWKGAFAEHVWMMKKYGITESWTEVFSIGLPPRQRKSRESHPEPVAYSRNKDKVLVTKVAGSLSSKGDTLAWYDLKTNSMKNVGRLLKRLPGEFSSDVTLNSLVSLEVVEDAALNFKMQR